MARLNDLIRCENAIKEICKRTCTPGVFCPDAYCKEVKEWITDDMVVDAVPVVRCKDCEWWTKQDKSLQGRCARYGTYPTGAWFCAAGRKDGDGNG